MTEAEAADRVEACHEAFLKLRHLSHRDRAGYLGKIAQGLRDNADELAALMTRETGKLLKDGHTGVEICAAIFDYTAKTGPDLLADGERRHGPDGKRGIVSYQPSGVIYSIQPWNFPLYQPTRKGAFYPATMLADLAPGMPAHDDEIFGPVASIIRARDDADAMRLANDSRYGLGGGIFSRDEDRALKLAREHGGFELKEFVNVKAMFLP